MPYPGIKPGSEAEQKMESCVKEVMATGKNKSSAIAICHNSIMGGKKVDSGSLPNQITFNINLKDYWNTVNTGANGNSIRFGFTLCHYITYTFFHLWPFIFWNSVPRHLFFPFKT